METSKSRRLVPRRFGFWASGLLLAVAIVVEAFWSLLRTVIFPFYSATARAKMCRIISESEPMRRSTGMTAILVTTLALALGGCQTASVPGSSFEKQIDELTWSVQTLFFDESPPQQIEEMATDFKCLFIWHSWDDEKDQLAETFSLLGW
jgi:hypothetical protein